VTWAWYAAILLLGSQLRENRSWLRIGGAALASSASFFVVSNFAVWACWNMYPKTLSGLMTCYAAGAAVLSARSRRRPMLFTAIMFGLPALAAMFGSSKTEGTAAAA
jgi:hypothetical protein